MEGTAATELKKVLLIGFTGVGKTATADMLTGFQGKFVPAGGCDSDTCDTVSGSGRLLPRLKGEVDVMVIDTPGFGDSRGADTDNVGGMAEFVKQQVAVDVIMLVINSTSPRFSEPYQEMIQTFAKVFGSGFLQHMILGFSRFGFDKDSERRRERTGQQMASEFSNKIIEQVEIVTKVKSAVSMLPYICYDTQDVELDTLMVGQEFELQKIHDFVLRSKSFDCRGIVAIQTEKDRLRAEFLEQQKANEALRIKNEALRIKNEALRVERLKRDYEDLRLNTRRPEQYHTSGWESGDFWNKGEFGCCGHGCHHPGCATRYHFTLPEYTKALAEAHCGNNN